jgi:hypothetical protein
MKTITLFSFFFILCTVSAQSQISKGSILLGGSISFSNNDLATNSDAYKNRYVFVQPSLGFAVKENRVVGFNLSYGHGIIKSGTISTETNQSNDYGGGVFYRRYLPLGKGFYLYGQGSANFAYNKVEQTTSASSQVQKLNTLSLSAYPGVSYAVSKRFHLELAMNNLVSVNYSAARQEISSNSVTQTSKSKQLNLYANVNPQSNLSFGFRILL